MIYDPLLGTPPTNTSELTDRAGAVVVDGAAPTLEVNEQAVHLTVDDQGMTVTPAMVSMAVIVDESPSILLVQEQRPTVIVDEHGVSVVSIGIQGPAGPSGGGGGSSLIGQSPIVTDYGASAIRLAPGTVSGQGLVWSGTGWENRQVIPGGVNGTVPYKSGSEFSGDGTNFRYNAGEQSLFVANFTGSTMDGGNF